MLNNVKISVNKKTKNISMINKLYHRTLFVKGSALNSFSLLKQYHLKSLNN